MRRERYIDLVKGLSILCITFLHYERGILPSCVNTFIGSFMITAFYITSGWVAAMQSSQPTFKALIKKRWKQLGKPYLWWTAIIIMFDLILFALGYYDISYIGKEIYKAITLRGIGTLWFLPALFGGEILWFYLKGKKNIWLIIIFLIVSLCYQNLYNYFFENETEIFYQIINAPFCTINNILGAWIGIGFGYCSYTLLKSKILVGAKYKLVSGGLLFTAFAFITANYLPPFLSLFWHIFAPLWGPLGLLLLAKSVQQCRFFDFFNFWGVNSLNLMVTHYSIVMVLMTIILKDGFNATIEGWTSIIVFIISMPIQYLLVVIIDRYAKFLLGR